MSETSVFDASLALLLAQAAAELDLPDETVERLGGKVRQIHDDNPALDLAEAVRTALGVLCGEGVEARFLAEVYEAQAERARAEAARLRRRIEGMERIEAAAPELERLERLYPGRASVAAMLGDAGATWESVGLQADDEALLEELLVRAHAEYEGCSDVA
ncbi:hypothetical protein [Streptomyces sp. NPDC001205]